MEGLYLWILHENCLRIFVEGLHIWSRNKTRSLALEPKSTVLSHPKKRHFLDTKKFRFCAQSSGSRGQPKKHSKKTWPRRRKMIKNVFQKIPQKNHFFWNCSEQTLRPGRKNAIFSHKEDSQNIVIFSASDVQKTAKIRPPPRWVRRHDKNKYPRKGNMYSERFPKKVRFFWDFSKCKLRESEFPRLFVI